MDLLLQFLIHHSFGLLLLAAALVLGLVLLLRLRRGRWSLALLLLSTSCTLMGLGGLAGPGWVALHFPGNWSLWAGWLVGSALAALFVMLVVVVLTGHWSARLGFTMGGLLLFGLGGLCEQAVSQGLAEGVRTLARLEVVQPWWLLLLGLIPVIIALSFRSLAGLGPVRRRLAIGLRCVIILLLSLALAEVRLRYQNETVTVFFLVDRSLSIPEEIEETPEGPTDLRWERIKKFINDSVRLRGPGHDQDDAGVIVFGRRPRLELPASDVRRLNFTRVASTIDNTYTDIGAAIKLALASFPEGTGKRLVLISDGNENLGNAEEQTQIARLNGVQIDVVPLAAGHKNENEVLVQSVEAPPETAESSKLPIRVLVRSYYPRLVVGHLTLNQITEGQSVKVGELPDAQLQPGLNVFTFKKWLADRQQSYTYEAVFVPTGHVNEQNQMVGGGLPGDHVENNRATTNVLARGQRRVLLIESQPGEHQLLLQRLRGRIGAERLDVEAITPDQLPQNKDELAVRLSNYDCVILANVSASNVAANVGDAPDQQVRSEFTEEQQEVIRGNTYDQGCGLIMIGGPNGFGAGGWKGSPVEKALPVDCDVKSLKVQGKGGLVLIMHASEMPEGNRWQKEIAKLAIKKLSSVDEVGVLYFDWGATKWHIPLQEIGDNRDGLLHLVDTLSPGDMPEFDTGLQMAYQALMEEGRQLATRHIIVISDGDPVQNNGALLTQMMVNKVTVSTVGVATHGAPQDASLLRIATSTGGRFYSVKDARQLPAIYIKETRLVSQAFIYETKEGFPPRLAFKSGPTDNLPDRLNLLFGYDRTTPKPSPLVEMPILGPAVGDLQNPILAYWHYGLGKAVAFTSDARTHGTLLGWDRDWARSDMYTKFWEQVVDWSLRAVESGRLTMTTEFRDGKVRVIVDARDAQNRPLIDLNLRGAVTPPSLKQEEPRQYELRFRQTNSGIYEAEFQAQEEGSCFIDAQATRKVKVVQKDAQGKEREVEVEEGIDSVRSGVTIPYSPEFADTQTNTPLLEKLRALTEGKTYPDDPAALEEAARSGEVYRKEGLPVSRSLQPVWFWLLLLAGMLLVLDVGVRRIAVDPAEAARAAERLWDRLRGRAPLAEPTPQFLERLKSRKAQIGETLEQSRAAQRFEPETSAPPPPPPAAAGTPSPPPPPPPGQVGPQPEEEPADFTSRLMKAKKRIWEKRDKDKPS